MNYKLNRKIKSELNIFFLQKLSHQVIIENHSQYKLEQNTLMISEPKQHQRQLDRRIITHYLCLHLQVSYEQKANAQTLPLLLPTWVPSSLGCIIKLLFGYSPISRLAYRLQIAWLVQPSLNKVTYSSLLKGCLFFFLENKGYGFSWIQIFCF